MSHEQTRRFSTTSGVHPAYLPSLHRASRVEKKLVPAAVAVVGIGYGISKYKQIQAEHQQTRYSDPTQSAAHQRQSDTLMDAYGDRSSLAELESAIRAYEEQRSR